MVGCDEGLTVVRSCQIRLIGEGGVVTVARCIEK